jgi:hypothetical protein
MAISLAYLQANLEQVIDEILATGEVVEIEYQGRTLKIKLVHPNWNEEKNL